MPIHICPVCGTRHPINAVEHPFAYGRQLTCGPQCKHRLRQQVRQRILAELALRAAAKE
ncbi:MULTISPECIES: hypothetical protein [Azospira]|uniref:Uncharacterized protein n=1 Tax=Azospira oryzae (strain ATCC BAA-33 / DSM 13638 / PS) TaxID=640081 RepID=G8QN98_AZOOP|nr:MULTISPECIES: hypothetical protein [Azospira]AEV24691.1 hypothetical protein Dsui_0273 [Azospira oryzae PS]MDK9691799.1 hypothetical protein [Azospira sp.]BBN88787.1 hypothetical protein AZSP09_18100 [Azospira sp. I09]